MGDAVFFVRRASRRVPLTFPTTLMPVRLFSRPLRSLAFVALALLPALVWGETIAGRWAPEAAHQWMAERPWSAGCNYVPQNAINQLEMWQAETFDPATIDRELGWAREIGFNSMRIFLHDLAWEQDPEGFFGRVDHFLKLADKHGISVLMVIFDSVWDPYPKPGPQRAPQPGVHNSGWVQSPGIAKLADESSHARLEHYVKAVLTRYRHDRRIIGWDLFNEPQNPNTSSYGKVEVPQKEELALRLLRKTYAWAREINPSQPLTAGVWDHNFTSQSGPLTEINTFMLENADIISFHCYDPLEKMQQLVAFLQQQGRPIACTEYMARPNNNRFENVLAFFKEKGVAAYNWGFVAGKSQTNYPWDSWEKAYAAEPPEWFHDILKPDGSAYRLDEVVFLKNLLRPANKPAAATLATAVLP